MKLDRKRIGKRCREIRKQAGLTQELFGEKLGLSKNHISDIERGCSLPTVKVLFAIYTEFGNTPDEILLGSKHQGLSLTAERISYLSPTGLRLLEKQLDNLLEEGL